MEKNEQENIGIVDPNTAYRLREIASDTRDFTKEFTMPDYIPNIKKVVRTTLKTSVGQVGADGDRTQWECTLTFNVLLLCEDGTLRSVALQGRQEGEITAGGECENTMLEERTENLTMRASDPRRLTARCRVCVSLWGNCPVKVGCDMGQAEANIEKLRGTENYTVVSKAEKNDIRVSDDIELGANDAEISDILLCEISPAIMSAEIAGETAELRGEATVSVLYTDASGGCHDFRTRIPITADVELNESDAVCVFVSAEVDEIKAAAQTNTYGEQKIIELDFSWDADVYAASRRECETVKDMYSTSDELELHSGTSTLARLGASFTDKLRVENEISAEDLSFSRASDINAVFADAEVESLRGNENGDVEVVGHVRFCIVGESDDENERYIAAETRLPFRHVHTCALDTGEPEYRAEAKVTGCRASMSSGTVTLEADVVVSALVWENFSVSTIIGADVMPSGGEERPPITLYYLDDDDDLWKIAKKYRISADEILDKNGITREEIKNKKVISIPREHRNPYFTQVI